MAEPKLCICVSDDEEDMRDFFATYLPRLGHEVVGVAKTGRELIKMVAASKPDLIIADIVMPEMDGIEAAKKATETHPAPVILVTGHVDEELKARALDDNVVAYLIKPIDEHDLKTAIPIAMKQFRRFLAVKMEGDLLKTAIHDRKVLERAKGIIMSHAKLTEGESLHRLQKLAVERGQTLINTAQMIIDAEMAINPPPEPVRPSGKERPKRGNVGDTAGRATLIVRPLAQPGPSGAPGASCAFPAAL